MSAVDRICDICELRQMRPRCYFQKSFELFFLKDSSCLILSKKPGDLWITFASAWDCQFNGWEQHCTMTYVD